MTAPKMLWIRWLVSVSHLRKNQSATVWETVKNLKALFCNGYKSRIVIHNPHADPHRHQQLISSRESSESLVADAYHVWSTSVSAFMNYPAHRQTDRQTDRMNEQSHYSASLGGATSQWILYLLKALRYCHKRRQTNRKKTKRKHPQMKHITKPKESDTEDKTTSNIMQ